MPQAAQDSLAQAFGKLFGEGDDKFKAMQWGELEENFFKFDHGKCEKYPIEVESEGK